MVGREDSKFVVGEEMGERSPKVIPSWLWGEGRGREELKERLEAGAASSGFVSALFLLFAWWSVGSSVIMSWSRDVSLGAEKATRLLFSLSDISSESSTTGSL